MAAPSGNGRKPQNGQRRNTQGSTTRKTASTRNTASSGRKVNNTRNSASEEELDTDFLKIVIYFVIIAFANVIFLKVFSIIFYLLNLFDIIIARFLLYVKIILHYRYKISNSII